MKKLVVANWKEHKTTSEARDWLSHVAHSTWDRENNEVILCPSFALLPIVKAEIDRLQLPIKLGSQDFPAFDEGAYTGEESPRLLKEYVHYAIIGHSERRNSFAEANDLLEKKIKLAKQYEIEPVFCIQNLSTPIHSDLRIIAYEPIFAIGTGNPDTPENAENIAQKLKQDNQNLMVLYGGSVTEDNVFSFMSSHTLSGVLVGTASLDPQSFSRLIQAM